MEENKQKDYIYLKELIAKDSDYLEYLLGMELNSSIKGVTDFDKNELKESGKKWIEKNIEILKNKICSEEIRKLSELNDTKLLYLAILDVVMGALTGVSPFTVSAIIIKRGLNKICSS